MSRRNVVPTPYKPIPEDPEFTAWYAYYPKKVAKGEAKRAWEQTRSIRPPTPQLIKAVIAQKASDQWRADGGAYIPNPASWLRAERWEDSTEVELQQVTADGVMWWETNGGIERKAKEMGEEWDARTETWLMFVERLKRKARVVPIQEARQVAA